MVYKNLVKGLCHFTTVAFSTSASGTYSHQNRATFVQFIAYTSFSDPCFCVFRTQQAFFSLCTEIHQNWAMFVRFKALSLFSSRWQQPSWKMAVYPRFCVFLTWAKKLLLGTQTPNFEGFVGL
jgi:hypothetical protein